MEYFIKNKNKVIICIIIISIILLTWIIVAISGQNVGTSNDKFSSVKDLFNYMDTKYIKTVNSKQNDYDKEIYLTFKFPPSTESGLIYEEYYNNLSYELAALLSYDNFILIDETNNINVKVKCDKENKIITSFMINNDENYFANLENKNEIATYEKEEKKVVTINSGILNSIVKNNWSKSNINFGNKVSTVDSYDIYFNEGLKVKLVNETIFNIIFTNKYSENVINGTKTSMNVEEIVKILGTPNYGSIDEGIVGYAFDKMYAFYSSNTISIYPYIDYSNSKKISSLLDSMKSYLPKAYDDLINYFMESSQQPPVIDKEEYYPDNGVIVQSTLMGIKFAFNTSLKDGVYFYSNFDGYVYDDKKLSDIAAAQSLNDMSDIVYIRNENLMYENEKERTTKYTFDVDSGLSNGKFGIYFISTFDRSVNSYQVDGINIIVKNNVYPDFVINNAVKTPKIISDYKFVYSVENIGIYLCDVSTREQKLIVSGEGKFKIKEYKDNILKYDDKEINLDLN